MGKAFKAFFENIPDDCGMAFVIVGCHKMTVQVLQEYIAMPVLAVKDDMKMMPNHVFICPEDKDTGVVRGNFYLREPLSNPRKPLDYFLAPWPMTRVKMQYVLYFPVQVMMEHWA